MYTADDTARPAEYGPILMVQGRYHVVAVKRASPADDPVGYAVLTSAGGLVRHELTLDDAKQWAQKLAELDQEPSDTRPAPPRERRSKRR